MSESLFRGPSEKLASPGRLAFPKIDTRSQTAQEALQLLEQRRFFPEPFSHELQKRLGRDRLNQFNTREVVIEKRQVFNFGIAGLSFQIREGLGVELELLVHPFLNTQFYLILLEKELEFLLEPLRGLLKAAQLFIQLAFSSIKSATAERLKIKRTHSRTALGLGLRVQVLKFAHQIRRREMAAKRHARDLVLPYRMTAHGLAPLFVTAPVPLLVFLVDGLSLCQPRFEPFRLGQRGSGAQGFKSGANAGIFATSQGRIAQQVAQAPGFAEQLLEARRQRHYLARLVNEARGRSYGKKEMLQALQLVLPLFQRPPRG